MKNTYIDLIDQSYDFPQEGFDVDEGYLTFNDVPLKSLIDKYGTPLRIMYLPKIADQIKRVRSLFNEALKKNNYKGVYVNCYCTKCNHFAPVIKKALKQGVQIETSSAYDIDLIKQLAKEEKLDRSIILIHNGYKTEEYLDKILSLHKMGFENSTIILDSMNELARLKKKIKKPDHPIQIGIRMAIDEAPQGAYYTSRLGIRQTEIINFYEHEIKGDKRFDLKMLHFFVDSGIKDNLYYWGEFQKAMKLFAVLKKKCKSLTALNLGGGFPIRNNLGFDYDYEGIVNEIVQSIKNTCVEQKIDEPDIFTEFGKFTVGESGAIIFSVLEEKQQNDNELWYMVDNSLMNTIPDAWSIFEKFILLPINKWDHEYAQVNIGGISCDSSDYYNSEDLNQQILLPLSEPKDKEPLYVGFFHTGAYQDAISGYGGIKHCLIPSPKYVLLDKDKKGNIVDTLYRDEQSVNQMLAILGYNVKED